MRFGEFLLDNRIKGLEDGYIDYGRLVKVLEDMEVQTYGRRLSEDTQRVSLGNGMMLNSERGLLAPVGRKAMMLWINFTELLKGIFLSTRKREQSARQDTLVTSLLDSDEIEEGKMIHMKSVRVKNDTFEEFTELMDHELSRGNAFAENKLEEVEVCLENLLRAAESTSKVKRSASNNLEQRQDSKIPDLDRSSYHLSFFLNINNESMERAYREAHLLILQLKQMTALNLTGYLKAAKKCKKITGNEVLSNFREETCCSSDAVDRLAEELSQSYANHFTGGNINKARAKLMVYKGTMRPSLKLGYLLGVDTTLTMVFIWFATFQPAKTKCPYCIQALLEAIPVYRVIFLPVLFIWGWSVLVYIWRSYGINYLWILDINPKTELGVLGAASMAASMTSFCLASIILYVATVRTGYSFLNIPLYCYPLGLIIVSFLVCIAPPGIFYFKSRKWFFRTLGTIFQRVIAPFGPEVRFRENFIADVLTSMVAWIVDLESTIVYYFSGNGFQPGIETGNTSKIPTAHIITAIPYWFRVQECLRRYMDTQDGWHLVNCGKYLMSLSSICLAAVGNYVRLDGNWSTGKCAWFVLLLATTFYCYWWDICMDWGVLSKKGFRKQLGLSNAKWFYIFAIITNFIGRIAWAFTITPHSLVPGLSRDSSVTIVATLEILRRCQWTLLRVEWEYIGNPTKYRSITQVPILLTFESEREQIHPMRATIIAGANTLLVVIVVIVAFIHFRTHHSI